MTVQSQYSVCTDTHKKFQTGWSSLEGISKLIDTVHYHIGYCGVHGHAPVVQLVILDLKGDVVAVRAGEDEVLSVLLVH